VRSIAIVVGVVLGAIGTGAGLVGGTGTPAVPRGWVAVRDGDAQISVPADWKVVFNDPCGGPLLPGVLYVATHVLPADFCPLIIEQPQAAMVAISPNSGVIVSIMRPRAIDSIPVWMLSQDGTTSVEVPSLGIEIYASGPGVQAVINTLTFAPGR
jgi:hypothetical protein